MSLRRDMMSWGLVGLVLLIVAGTAFYVLLPHLQPHVNVHLGDGLFRARVVDTPAGREKGLSGTTHLPRDEALLFVYDTDEKWSIWMKDMNYDIDIVWLNKNKETIYIVKNVSPDTYPEGFAPNQSARYVLEFAAGTVDAKSIAIGDQAKFDENNIEGLWR